MNSLTELTSEQPARSSATTSLPSCPDTRTTALATLSIFAAFFLFDLYWVARSLPHAPREDEWRYIYYAENLLHGFFSPRPRIFLWNGPGYPLVLVPFVKLGWVDGARYANAVWHAAAMSYAWLTLRARLRPRWALGALIALGLYLPLYKHLALAQTEVFCFFLVAAWIEHSLRAQNDLVQRLVAASLLALLCLTKVVFGVVLMLSLAPLLVLWLRRRHERLWRSSFLQAALALLLCLPYLAYTHNLTGRWLYWSSAGPNSFYWLTSPYAEEWGDWYHHGWVERDPMLRAHHKAIMDQISGVARDPSVSFEEQLFNISTPEASDALMRAALRNVREHPLKFVRNWCANVPRMFLDVPTSVRGTPFWNVYTGVDLPWLGWTAFLGAFAWRRRIRPPEDWWPLGLFFSLSLAVYSLSSAVARYLIPLVPIWWIGSCSWLGTLIAPRKQLCEAGVEEGR